MRSSTRSGKVWVYGIPINGRPTFDVLTRLIVTKMGHDIAQGDYFLFINVSRQRLRVLHWDGTAFDVYVKQLRSGRFMAPWMGVRGDTVMRLVADELALMLDGSEWAGRVTLSPAAPISARTTQFTGGI